MNIKAPEIRILWNLLVTMPDDTPPNIGDLPPEDYADGIDTSGLSGDEMAILNLFEARINYLRTGEVWPPGN